MEQQAVATTAPVQEAEVKAPEQAAAETQIETQKEETAPAPQGGEPLEFPEKFRGKDWNTVARSAMEAEKFAGTKAEEARKAKEEAERYKQELDQYRAAQVQKPVQSNPIEQIEETFRKEMLDSPDDAVINYHRRLNNLQAQQVQARETQNKYEKAKSDEVNYPRFRELEPVMIDLAQRHAHLINPNQFNSPETIDVLYKLAVAESLKDQLEQAKARGVSEATRLEQEKGQAFGESGSPAGSRMVSTKELSASEMEKQYGFLDK